MASLLLMGIPIIYCLAVSLGMGRKPVKTSAGVGQGETDGKAKAVVAVMCAAPLAAESEGGMPVDLLRIIDEPVLARGQTERVAVLYHRWALRNAGEAAQSALANARLFDSLKPLETVLAAWITAEPEGAMNWVLASRTSPGKAERVEEAFAPVLDGKSVEVRAAWAARNPDDVVGMSRLAAEWGRSDADAAMAWVETLPGGEGKAEGLRALLASWMESDPAAAGAFVAAMPRGPMREVALVTVAEISPGGVAVAPARALAAGESDAEDGEVDWLVREEGKSGPPRTLKRRPGTKEEP